MKKRIPWIFTLLTVLSFLLGTKAAQPIKEVQAQINCPQMLADYMNAIIDGKKNNNLGNIKVLSPAFALTTEFSLFQQMEAAGARFGELDGFAGNSYSAF